MLLCVPEAYKAGVACCRLKLERLFQFRRILPSREKIQQPVLSPSGCGRLGTEPGRDPR